MQIVRFDGEPIYCGNCGMPTGNFDLDGFLKLNIYLKWDIEFCYFCKHYFVYRYDPTHLKPGDRVYIVSKSIDPEIGSYTPLMPHIHFCAGDWGVKSVNDAGGIYCVSMKYPWRAGVFHGDDLVLLAPALRRDLFSDAPTPPTTPQDAPEEPPKLSWFGKFWNWWERKVLGLGE